MFNPRKTDNFPSNPGTFGVILAALITLSVLTQLFSSGAAPKVILGGAGLFALWWLYGKFPKKNENELTKYREAVRKQKRRKATEVSTGERGKVVYLNTRKRKKG